MLTDKEKFGKFCSYRCFVTCCSETEGILHKFIYSEGIDAPAKGYFANERLYI